MRFTDYLPHGPTMSTPPTERVRDVLAARYRLSRTGFALIICIFALMPLALPTFGHDTQSITDERETHELDDFWKCFTENGYVDADGNILSNFYPLDQDYHFHMSSDGQQISTGGGERPNHYDGPPPIYVSRKCSSLQDPPPQDPPPQDPPPQDPPPDPPPATESNATIGVSEATGVITDNDLPLISVTTNQTVVEEGETVTFTLTRTSDLTMPLTVPVRITERGAFLDDGAPTEAAFAANAATTTLQVATVDDKLDEENGAVTATIADGETYQVGDAASATVEITDNDLPVVSVAADPAAVEEGETVTFTLTRIGDLSMPLTVPVRITERGVFLDDGAPTEATFAANAATTAFQVATVDDKLDEENGAVTATIADGETYQVGDAASATVEITDNDLPVVSVAADPAAVEEGETVTFTLTRIGDLSMPLTVPVRITERGVFLDDGAPTEAAFAANAATTAFQVATVDDKLDEENGAVTATIADGETYQVGDAASATVEITDNDEPDEVVTQTETETDVVKIDVTVSFTATRYEASEDDAALRFAVQLSTESHQEVTVQYATASGTATAGEDYEARRRTLTFPAGTTRQTIRVPIIDDDVVEEEETFTVRLRDSNATIGEGRATGAIADNDILAVVNISADPTAVAEGGTAAFTLTRGGNLTAPLTVPVRVTESGAFLTDEVPTAATFAANAATATLLVATDDDERDEADGAVTATIMDGPHQIGDAASATVLVTDNDVRGVTVAPTALTVREGESVGYTVKLNTEPTAGVTVAVQVPAGAEVSVDKTALTFTAENWNQAQTVTVTAAQDADAVADNPVTIRHAVSGGDYGAIAAASVVATIIEDDTPTTREDEPPTIRIADAAAAESDGTMAFAVRLSVASIQTVTVEYATDGRLQRWRGRTIKK